MIFQILYNKKFPGHRGKNEPSFEKSESSFEKKESSFEKKESSFEKNESNFEKNYEKDGRDGLCSRN